MEPKEIVAEASDLSEEAIILNNIIGNSLFFHEFITCT